MRRVLLILVLVLPGCWQSSSDSDNVTTVWVVRNTGYGTTASGGGVVQVTGLSVPGFVFDEPVVFLDELPEPDRGAVAEAETLVLPDATVIDALRTPDGLLTLVREPEGIFLAILTASPIVRASAPEDALRLLPAGDDPLRVLVVLADGQAVLATRAESD